MRILLPLLPLVFLASCATGGVAQPHMQNARNALERARGELEAAAPNKGGHRARAIALVDRALGEVQAGMEFADTH